VLFITGPGKASIENHFDLDDELTRMLRETGKEDLLGTLEFERAPMQFFYTRQRQLLGLGHAVLCAQSFVGEQPFVVALGDSIIGLQNQSDVILRMKHCFNQYQADAVIAFEEVPLSEVHQYGIALPANGASPLSSTEDNETFAVADVIEKPNAAEAPSNLAIAARYIFAPSIFEALKRTRPGKGGEIQLTDAIRLILQMGGKVYGVRLHPDEPRYDIGNFESYFRAFVEFALADEKYGASLRQYLEALLNAHHS
jgi:UTP--glucose-1-phosphate uridylyltransferase